MGRSYIVKTLETLATPSLSTVVLAVQWYCLYSSTGSIYLIRAQPSQIGYLSFSVYNKKQGLPRSSW